VFTSKDNNCLKKNAIYWTCTERKHNSDDKNKNIGGSFKAPAIFPLLSFFKKNFRVVVVIIKKNDNTFR
jgi:hypothetical protein